MKKTLNVEEICDRARNKNITADEAFELAATGVAYAAVTLATIREEEEVLTKIYEMNVRSPQVLVHLLANKHTPESVLRNLSESEWLSKSLLHEMVRRENLSTDVMKNIVTKYSYMDQAIRTILRHPNCDEEVIESLVAARKDNRTTPESVRKLDTRIRLKQLRKLLKETPAYADWPEEWVAERFEL